MATNGNGNGNGWNQTITTILVGGGMLVAATVYIDQSNRQLGEDIRQIQIANERRITSLETQTQNNQQNISQLLLKQETQRGIEENLTTAVEILNEKLSRDEKRR